MEKRSSEDIGSRDKKRGEGDTFPIRIKTVDSIRLREHHNVSKLPVHTHPHAEGVGRGHLVVGYKRRSSSAIEWVGGSRNIFERLCLHVERGVACGAKERCSGGRGGEREN